MANPPPQTEAPDSGAALSRAYPGLARRLATAIKREEPDMSLSQPRPPKTRRPSFLKRAEQYVAALLKLGRTYRTVKDTSKHVGHIESRIAAVADDLTSVQEWRHEAQARLQDVGKAVSQRSEDAGRPSQGQQGAAIGDRNREPDSSDLKQNANLRTELSETAADLRRQIALCEREQASLSRAYSDLTRRLDLTRNPAATAVVPEPESSGLDALTESFYARLEDRFRGSREEIKQRLVKYLPDAEAAIERIGKPILDLGCGRGEWIEVLSDHGMTATGVDLNEMQLREARALGLDVHLGDACAFLAQAKSGSYSMITAHHLAEHLPFKTLVWITREALRVLAPGGRLLYETPNPRNVVVGASSFHVDPTHRRPLPNEVLTTLLDTVGFHPVESRFLHQHPKYDELIREARLDAEIAGLLFGPQDLAVLGTKPGVTA